MPDLDDGYAGPAELIIGDLVVAVTVTFAGHFDPITGSYCWYGRVAASAEVTALLTAGARTAVLRTPHGSVDTKLSDIDPGAVPASRVSVRHRSRCSMRWRSTGSAIRTAQSGCPWASVVACHSIRRMSGVSILPTSPYEVGREKIREFADAVGDMNPVYRDPAAARALGYPDVIAPPTFPIVLTLTAGHQVITDPDFGLDYSKVVHGEQRFVHSQAGPRRRRAAGGRHGRRRACCGRQRHRHHSRRPAHGRG